MPQLQAAAHSWLLRLALLLLAAFVLTGEASARVVVVGLRQQRLKELEALFWRVSTPGNDEYLRFRSVPELADLVGASADDIAAARQWLIDAGADVGSIKMSPLKDALTTTFHEVHEPQFFKTLAAERRPAAVDFVIRRHGQFRAGTSVQTRKSLANEAPDFGSYTVSNIKKAYGIPEDLQASNKTALQMVWGPGTFGYSQSQLESFKERQCPLLDTSKVVFDSSNHGQSGGDNYGEGNLDTQMISAFGLNVKTLVSNTNASSATEEGQGFGQAMLDFVTELPSRSVVPQVLSLSLGSLSAYSCDLLITEGQKAGFSDSDVRKYLQQQRQVCMFLSKGQVTRINTGLQLLGLRGVSVFGSSGDGGSHFSFQPFRGGAIADALNKISCEYQMPIFPSPSPYMISVGGTDWSGFLTPDPLKPKAWSGSGGGFSWQFAAPEHQRVSVAAYLQKAGGAMPPSSSFNASGRAYPDLSAVAVMGTSQSSPIVAGIFSLIMDHRLNMGLPPLGFLAPRLWKTQEEFPGEAFESVDTGNTKTSCDNGFPAEHGWDPVTGWGRPRWGGLLKHFGGQKSTSQTSEIIV